MLKPFLYLLIIGIFLSSCQQELSDVLPIPTTDSTLSTKLKKIHVTNSDPNDPFDFVFSIQYDSANRKIKVYVDDTTTTTTIFDLLAYEYEFNPGGYLTKVSALNDFGTFAPLYAIQRNTSNEIQEILEYDPLATAGTSAYFTRHFSYATTGGTLTVKDSFMNPQVVYFQSQEISYNANHTPASNRIYYTGFDNVFHFVYNAQNELTTINGTFDTTKTILDKTQTALGWNAQAETFLGKDAYLLSEIQSTFSAGINFLTFFLDDKFETPFNPLLSPPLLKLTRQGWYDPFNSQYGNVVLNFTNTFLPDHRLSSITINGTRAGMSMTNFGFTYY